MIATCFALIGFASSLLVGAVAGNPATTVIYRSLVGMVICYIIGSIVAHVGQRAVQQSVERYKQTHPITDGSTTEVNGDESNTVGRIDQDSESIDTSRSAA